MLVKDFSRPAHTYDFAIEIVFLHHDDVDTLGVLERQKAEASRAASSRVTHDGTFADLAELREVILERF